MSTYYIVVHFFHFSYVIYDFIDFILYSLLVLLVIIIMILLCYLISLKNLYFEKTSAYECGFDPFSDAREKFHINFYIIAILFIIFDIELIYFLPWALCLYSAYTYGFYVLLFFFFNFVLCFFYEWRKQSLEF